MLTLRKQLYKWHRTYDRTRTSWHHLKAILWPSKVDEPVIHLLGKVWIILHGVKLHQRVYCYANHHQYVEVQVAVHGAGLEARPDHQQLDIVRDQSLQNVGWRVKRIHERSMRERWGEARKAARRHLAGV